MLMSGKVFFRFEVDTRDPSIFNGLKVPERYATPTWASIPKSMNSAGYETFYREKALNANNPFFSEQFEHKGNIDMGKSLRTGRAAKGIIDETLHCLCDRHLWGVGFEPSCCARRVM